MVSEAKRPRGLGNVQYASRRAREPAGPRAAPLGMRLATVAGLRLPPSVQSPRRSAIPLAVTKSPRFPGRVLAIVAIVAVAALLRLWRVRLGLPDFLEEAIPFRAALGMMDVASGRVDWNPHSFNYPSLSIYLHFLVQQIAFGLGRLAGAYPSYADYVLSYYLDPTPMVIPARLLGIACDVAAIVGAIRLGERLARGAGWVAGILIAFAPILIATSRSIFCDSLMGALAVWALERMCAWRDSERGRDLVAAAVLAGLAAGAKYPAGVLVLPLALLVCHRRGTAGIKLACGMTAIAFCAFLATTPYAVLDPQAFARDFSFEGLHAAGGHFGSLGRRSFGFHLGNLAMNVGWIGVVLALAAPALLPLAGGRRSAFLAAWLALLGFGVPISLAAIPAERYLVPVILIAAPLAAASGILLLSRFHGFRRRGAVAFVALALLGPVLDPGIRTASSGSDTTQLEARRWCEASSGDSALIVQEGYAARLPSRIQLQNVRSEPAYRNAGERVRQQADSVRAFHVVTLPLGVAGQVTSTLQPPGRPPERLVVVPHASALNRVFYDPRLFSAADYIMTSSAVRGRFEADAARYPTECAFYRFVDAHAEVVARFGARGTITGPEIVVYRVGSRFREAARSLGPLDSLWWTEAVPTAYRERAQALLEPGRSSAADAADPVTPAWVTSLAGVHAERIRPFALDMAVELAALGRDAPAAWFAKATLAVQPDDLEASLICGACLGRLGRWDETRAVTERLLAGHRGGDAEPALVLLHARALDHTGREAEARKELEGLAARLGADDPVGARARALLARGSTLPTRTSGSSRAAAGRRVPAAADGVADLR